LKSGDGQGKRQNISAQNSKKKYKPFPKNNFFKALSQVGAKV
jgi:hypothetical protein